MYLCVKLREQSCICVLTVLKLPRSKICPILFRNCSDSVVLFPFHFIIPIVWYPYKLFIFIFR